MKGLLFQPLLIGAFRRYRRLQLFVTNNPSLFEINEEHTARLEPSFQFDVFRRDIEDTHFTGHDNLIVMRQVVATRTQAVPVQNRSDIVPVSKRNRCRAVPGFLQCRVKFIERALVFRH